MSSIKTVLPVGLTRKMPQRTVRTGNFPQVLFLLDTLVLHANSQSILHKNSSVFVFPLDGKVNLAFGCICYQPISLHQLFRALLTKDRSRSGAKFVQGPIHMLPMVNIV